MVVGIDGGSPLDAAKAIAGLLPRGQSVMDHLEGVGRGIAFSGPSLQSFRDEHLTAQVAIIDPELLVSCPRPQLVANAMDAFTQLLESYTSPRRNPITDALALSGIEHFLRGFSKNSEADLGVMNTWLMPR